MHYLQNCQNLKNLRHIWPNFAHIFRKFFQLLGTLSPRPPGFAPPPYSHTASAATAQNATDRRVDPKTGTFLRRNVFWAIVRQTPSTGHFNRRVRGKK